MVTGIDFLYKTTNLQVTNGKIFSDGDRDIIIGMGLPSLKEKLDVQKSGSGHSWISSWKLMSQIMNFLKE